MGSSVYSPWLKCFSKFRSFSFYPPRRKLTVAAPSNRRSNFEAQRHSVVLMFVLCGRDTRAKASAVWLVFNAGMVTVRLTLVFLRTHDEQAIPV